MTSTVKLGIIDDDQDTLDSIKANLEDIENLEISCFSHITEFEPKMDNMDIAIVDLCLEGNCTEDKSENYQGIKIVEKFLEKPLKAVIIYSAFTEDENPQLRTMETQGPFIKIITKGKQIAGNKNDTLDELFGTVKIFSEMFFGINELREKVDKAFTDILLKDSQELFEGVDIQSMREAGLQAYVSFRLSTIVSNEINSMKGKLPSQAIFMIPPLTLTDHNAYPVTTGDIFYYEEDEEDNDKGQLYMVVSPACDLVYEKDGKDKPRRPKTCNVLLAKLYKGKNDAECEIQASVPEDGQQPVMIPLNRNPSSYGHYYAPKKLSATGEIFIPFKNPAVMAYGKLLNLKKVATMAMPFSYEVQAGFAREIMRLGVPDLTDPEKDRKK
jgi:hypothetical protein